MCGTCLTMTVWFTWMPTTSFSTTSTRCLTVVIFVPSIWIRATSTRGCSSWLQTTIPTMTCWRVWRHLSFLPSFLTSSRHTMEPTRVSSSRTSRVFRRPLSSTLSIPSRRRTCPRCSDCRSVLTTITCGVVRWLRGRFHYVEGTMDQFRVFGLKDSAEPFYSLTYAIAPIAKVGWGVWWEVALVLVELSCAGHALVLESAALSPEWQLDAVLRGSTPRPSLCGAGNHAAGEEDHLSSQEQAVRVLSDEDF